MSLSQVTDLSQNVTKYEYSTQEQPIVVGEKKNSFSIGVPREKTFQENRVALTPESVHMLSHHGIKVQIETGAGNYSHYSDREYSEAGADIIYEQHKIYDCDIILQVTPPTLEEVEHMKTHQTIFSPLHLPSMKKKVVEKMMEKKITAIAYEYLQDDWGAYPIVRAMSEIAGGAVVLIASEYLSTVKGGKGILLGGITGVPPTNVVILGSGIVGETAAKAALGLGATVKIFDNSLYKLKRIQNNLGRNIYTSVLSSITLSQELKNADVVIGALHSKTSRTPILISESMVMNMKPNSVIIDVSIDQGGCFETSEMTNHDNPTFIKHDVIHYCVPNIPSRVSRTASIALSNILANTMIQLQNAGGIKPLIQFSKGVRHGAYLFIGNVCHQHFSQILGEKFIDLDLIFLGDL
ncbi:MAG: alanine dehydrogenase [Chitinophagales bacterium]|nr:alanine dehydrogenase [Chitinophagales bacterium]